MAKEDALRMEYRASRKILNALKGFDRRVASRILHNMIEHLQLEQMELPMGEGKTETETRS